MTVISDKPPPPPRFSFFTFPSFSKYLPLSKDRTYTRFKLRRNVFLLILLGLALALLALILGLAIGLTTGKHKGGSSFIPKPSSGTLQTGDATFYTPNLGACGIISAPEEPVVAISMIVWDAVQVGTNPNNNPLCGRKVWATRLREDGKDVSVVATVVDRCVGCKAGDLDFSPTLFEELAHPDLGRVTISWVWIDEEKGA